MFKIEINDNRKEITKADKRIIKLLAEDKE